MKFLFPVIFFFLTISSHAQTGGKYKVIAYYTGNGEAIRQFELNKLTHIIYSFLRLKNDTLCFHDSTQEATVKKLVALKKDFPHLKIMVSVGGWGGCAPCSDLFADAEHRDKFAKTAFELFRKYGIDGLDLDWEYPAIEGYPGHTYKESDRNHFTALVTVLRKYFGKKYLLSFAAGGFVKYLEQSVDWPAVMKQVDFVNLMTYDLVGGYATVTGHHTPLDGKRAGEESLTRCVDWLVQHGVKSKQLIAGAAFYARVWENVPDTNHGLYQSGKFKQGVSFRDSEKYFVKNPGYRYYWDSVARAPYCYNDSLHLFATFDDLRSVRGKADFVRRQKMGGMMFWELQQDDFREGLLHAMVDEWRRPADHNQRGR